MVRYVRWCIVCICVCLCALFVGCLQAAAKIGAFIVAVVLRERVRKAAAEAAAQAKLEALRFAAAAQIARFVKAALSRRKAAAWKSAGLWCWG